MKKTLTLFLALPPLLLSAQSYLVNNGAIIKIVAGANVRLDNGNISNKNSGTISNEGNLYLDGNFDQTTAATYTSAATGWLWFENNAAVQTLNAGGVPRLRIENGNTLQILADLLVDTELDFMNNSRIQLGNFNLITNNAVLSNYGAGAYVVTDGTGTLQQTMNSGDVKTFPVGRSSYNPAVITNNGISDDFQLRVEDIVYDYGTTGNPETQGVVNRSWYLSESTAGGSISDITVEWDASEELAFDRNACGVAHWNGSLWEHPSTLTAATNTGGTRWSQTRAGQTSFSPFAVEDLDLLLPIEWLAFNANRIKPNLVSLDWTTATETNNLGFELERMLDHESSFKQIGFVEGHGNSSIMLHYTFDDPNAYPQTSYYRLRQIDTEGRASYSEIRAVSGLGSANGTAISLYPNPSKGDLNIQFGYLPDNAKNARIRIFDILGVLVKVVDTAVDAYQQIGIDVQQLSAAAYWVEIRMSTGEQQILQFIRE